MSLDVGERPAEARPGESNYADLDAAYVALGLYADGMELQARAREEQVAECRELAED